jgi:predicted Fe-Mo cluster-binding NifX family protein
VPAFIPSHGVTVLLCGGIGRRALELFQQYGIQVVSGACSTVRVALASYLAGQLRGAAPCRESVQHADHEAERSE